MSELAGLEVKVTADLTGLVKEMKKADKSVSDLKGQLSRFKANLDSATDPKSVLRLNNAIAATEAKIKSLEATGKKAGAAIGSIGSSSGALSSGLNRLSGTSNTAGFALQNLGRIAQDAPFGFIGIANNINPLLESFQRLKAESGSTGTALKALGSSLLGAGGLGIAVSLISAAMTVFALNSRSASKDVEKTKKVTDEAAEAQREFASEISAASQAIVGQAKDLEDIRSILVDTTKVYEDLTVATKRQAFAQYLFGQRSEELKGILDATIKQQLLQAKIKDPFAGTGVRQYSQDLYAVKTYMDAVKNGTLRYSKAALEAAKNTQAVAESAADLANLNQLGKGFDNLFAAIVDGKGKKEKTLKDIRDVNDVLAEMRLKIRELNTEELVLNTDNAQERVSTFLNAIKELAVKFKLDPDGKLIQGLFDEAKFAKLGFVFSDGFARLGKASGKAFRDAIAADLRNNPIQDPTPTGFNEKPIESGLNGEVKLPKLSVDTSQIDELAKITFLKSVGVTKGIQDGLKVGLEGLRFPELEALFTDMEARLGNLNASINQAITAMVSQTISVLAEGIGSALAGGDLQNMFSSFLGILQSGLKAIGQSLVQFGIAKTIFENLKISGPAAIAAGFALQIFAGALKERLKIPGFANGVENFSGGLAMVGERGPELVRLPRGSDVIPNHELNGMSIGGGQSMLLSGEFRVRGTDLVLSLDRANQRLGRQN